MRTKDITLSASLIAIYVAVNVVGKASPISVSSLAGSAIFGLFWPFFSTRLNLTFQGLRVGYNMVGMIRSAPRIINMLKIESIMGLEIFDWVYGEFKTPIDLKAVELLESLGRIEMGFNFWIFLTGFILLFNAIPPYLFYRYFKAVGLFKRLSSF